VRIVLVLDLAHDLLDDVFEGHDARGAAVLVHDHREMGAAVCISRSRSSMRLASAT
jgi:hypothetical protein